MRRQPNSNHLKWLRTLPCIICGDNTSVEAAHVRYTSLRYGKRNPGMGHKPHDAWAVPLCGQHHRDQHAGDEWKFWEKHRIDPLFKAAVLFLHGQAGDLDGAMQVIEQR